MEPLIFFCTVMVILGLPSSPDNSALRDIATQLKRIADALENQRK